MSNSVLTVRTSEELAAAVEALASGQGGTVRLAPGSYAAIFRDTDGRTDAPVRLTSLDPEAPAVFTSLNIRGRENVSIDHVVFDSTGIERGAHHRDLELSGARNVEISDTVFHGGATEALVGSPDDVRGANLALIRGSEGVTIRDSHMSGYYQGLAFLGVDDLAITGNEITGFQGDGIRLGGVQDALIQGNHMHSMLGTSQDINHSDMIQFWGTNITQNNERITIRENHIDTSDGPAYQMIFGRNEHHEQNGWLFQDIVIEENVLHGAHYNMISIAQTENMVVRQNTVLWNRDTREILPGGEDGASVSGWIAAPASRGTVIEGNIAASVKDGTGANGIVDYDDPAAADHHARHFVNLDSRGTADLRDLTLRADSAWDGVLGASMTWSTRPADGLEATATVARMPGDRSRVTLDARLTRDEAGLVDDATDYVWTFEDGTVLRGAVVEHDFVTPGSHGYVLEARTADGRTDRIERKVDVADPDLLVLDFSQGRPVDASSYAAGLVVDGGTGPDGFVWDGASAIELSYAKHVFSLDSFGLALDVTLDAGTTGTVVELWKSFHGFVDADGRFVFEITTTAGDFRVATAPGTVPGGERAELGVVLDGPSGELRLLIDGEVEAATSVSGSTLRREHWDLTLGNKFSGHGAEGTLHGATLRSEPGLETGLAGVQGDGGSWDDRPALPDEALLVSLDFDEDVADASSHATRIAWNPDAATFAEGSDGTGRAMALGDRDDGVELTRGNGHLFGLDAFHVAFDLRRDALDEGGSVLALHETLSLKLDDAGRLTLDLATVEGRATVRSDAALLDDLAWHAVELAYDSAEARLELLVDGEVAGHAELTGATAGAKYWGLALGRTWGHEAPAYIDELRIWDEARFGGSGGAEVSGLEAASYGTSAAAGGAGLLASLSFDGTLAERDGRPVGVWADGGLSFTDGRRGEALRIGDDAEVAITRENAFLHERDAFAFSFDLRKEDAAGEGRVLHLHKAMTAHVADGELTFTLTTDEGVFSVASEGGALDDSEWHAVEIGYDDAADRLTLSVDGTEAEAHASGTTAPAKYWGLSLGAAWGDALEGAVDEFEMREAPDWALG
jgi:hypothetical protein